MLFLLSAGCLAGIPFPFAKAAAAIRLEGVEPAEREPAADDYPGAAGVVLREGGLGKGRGGDPTSKAT